MKRLTLTLGSSLVLLMMGCGGSVSTFSCDRRNNTTQPTCTDYSGVSGDTGSVKNSCTQQGGTVGATCTLTDAVGGCKYNAPAGEQGSVTVWYYSGTTQDVQQYCTAGSTFVTPQ
ncbi:MAG TPA: hypothetical protein VH877_23680 [Polyangia bacterium]|jgi:hypothetical protein|nr:hypothetical protein [Polyangia bacterium]